MFRRPVSWMLMQSRMVLISLPASTLRQCKAWKSSLVSHHSPSRIPLRLRPRRAPGPPAMAEQEGGGGTWAPTFAGRAEQRAGGAGGCQQVRCRLQGCLGEGCWTGARVARQSGRRRVKSGEAPKDNWNHPWMTMAINSQLVLASHGGAKAAGGSPGWLRDAAGAQPARSSRVLLLPRVRGARAAGRRAGSTRKRGLTDGLASRPCALHIAIACPLMSGSAHGKARGRILTRWRPLPAPSTAPQPRSGQTLLQRAQGAFPFLPFLPFFPFFPFLPFFFFPFPCLPFYFHAFPLFSFAFLFSFSFFFFSFFYYFPFFFLALFLLFLLRLFLSLLFCFYLYIFSFLSFSPSFSFFRFSPFFPPFSFIFFLFLLFFLFFLSYFLFSPLFFLLFFFSFFHCPPSIPSTSAPLPFFPRRR